MSTIDLHPEELLDRARRGPLDPSEERRLTHHLEVCPACRVGWEQSRFFALDTLPTDEDREVAARVWTRLRGRASIPPAPAPAPRRRASLAAVGAAAGLLLALSSAAAWWVATEAATEPTAPAPDRAAPHEAARGSARGAAAEPAVELDPPEETPGEPAAAPPAAPAAPSPAAAAAAAAAPHHEATAEAPSVAPAPRARRSAASAASWFARANEARRDRRYEDAADAYRTLLARYPGSREAEVAQLLLGRVLLVNLADARGALERFDAYLAHQPGGTLAPEARTGRARALESLGRSEEARAAWQEILDRHPASPHAALARRRVR